MISKPGRVKISKNIESGLSRRELLSTTAMLATGGMISACTNIPVGSKTSRSYMDIPGSQALIPENMPSGFSRQELMRRWQKCRQWMRESDFDVLLVATLPQGNADIKWFTEAGPNWVVFPQTGKPTAIFRTNEDARRFGETRQLDMNIVDSRLDRSSLIIESLKDIGVTNGRIGVGNLAGTMRNDEGGVSHITMQRLQGAFPNARFESAAEFLMRIKLSRGPEEINVLELASRVSELGLKAMVDVARPGVPQRDVWFHVYKAMLDASGEKPGRVSLRAGAEGNTAEGNPLDEIIQAGQILSEEISASVLGYNSQVNQAVCVGRPIPRNFVSTFEYNLDLFDELVDWARPGRTFADYSTFYKQKIDERIAAVGGRGYFGVVFHTAGALGDGPRMGWGRDDENSDLVIEPGMVFTIKPRVPIPGVETPSCQIGDAVLITEAGAKRLGRRKLEPIIIN